MDYAGPIDNHILLVVVDTFSKWIEVFPIKFASSATTIGKLQSFFATHRIPEFIVSDNGSPFTSLRIPYSKWCKTNYITLSFFQQWTC